MSRNFINIGDLDPETLIDSVFKSAEDIEYSHRRYKLYVALLKEAPHLAEIVDLIRVFDTHSTEEGESFAERGALMAFKAIADFSHGANAEYDVRDDATADYLAKVYSEDMSEALESSAEADEKAADDKGVRVNSYVRDRLSKDYPGICELSLRW